MEKSKITEDNTADEVTRRLPIMSNGKTLLSNICLKELKHPIC